MERHQESIIFGTSPARAARVFRIGDRNRIRIIQLAHFHNLTPVSQSSRAYENLSGNSSIMSRNQMGLLLLALSACAVTAQNQMQQGSFFAAPADGGLAYNGHDWWDVRTPEIPKMQSQAALFATAIKSSPGAFAGMFTELVALGYQVDAARSLAYLLNANFTLSGGCPNPPPTAFFTDQLGDAIVRAVALGRNTSDPTPQPLTLTGNLTDTQVANALIAGITLAAKSCGPPNHLSSSSAEQAREKYRNSSCYFVGPVLAWPMNQSTVFAAALAQAVDLTTVQNPWVLGAVLGGIQDCANGPEDLQDPPTWLPKSNGPIDDEERADTIPAIKLQRVQSQEESVPSLPKTQATTQQQIIPFTAVGGRRRLQATL
ncbi:hypothetical protein WJX75_007234 [Coccomyxa subellipsoidea]|uniref:Uncharacterized protein n=1 Tax=Coccomyxa subellipsoidea TaxID=248742 RepID=A0ABR2Z4D6_9CHLO